MEVFHPMPTTCFWATTLTVDPTVWDSCTLYSPLGLETICLLLAYKIKYPENFFMLRGNHESAAINRIYGNTHQRLFSQSGFYEECRERYNLKIWKAFNDCFNCLPLGLDSRFRNLITQGPLLKIRSCVFTVVFLPI